MTSTASTAFKPTANSDRIFFKHGLGVRPHAGRFALVTLTLWGGTDGMWEDLFFGQTFGTEAEANHMVRKMRARGFSFAGYWTSNALALTPAKSFIVPAPVWFD